MRVYRELFLQQTTEAIILGPDSGVGGTAWGIRRRPLTPADISFHDLDCVDFYRNEKSGVVLLPLLMLRQWVEGPASSDKDKEFERPVENVCTLAAEVGCIDPKDTSKHGTAYFVLCTTSF